MSNLSSILLSPKRAERHYIEIILVGFFYSSISIFLSLWIFPSNSSLAAIFLTVISCLYIVQSILITEEDKESDYKSEKWILKEHAKLIVFLSSLMFGFIISFTFWTIILPESVNSSIFSLQISTLKDIGEISKNFITGNVISNSGNAIYTIIANNFKVLLFSLIFALFYGAGAIFILVWNSSIIGIVIGTLARESLGLSALPIIFTKYMIHGLPEMIAYFIASLAGGIIFVTIIRGDVKKGKIKRIIIDVTILIALSITILLIAAFLEIYVSPFV